MNGTTSVRMLQAVAMTAGIALLLWSTGLPTFFRTAEAASITNASDTLSNSAPGLASNHTFAFTSPNGIDASDSIDIIFDNNFDLSSIVFTDVDINASGTDSTIVNGASGAGTWGFSTSTDTISLQAPNDFTAGSSSPFIIEIGSNATTGATGVNQIVNPSATSSYAIDIDAGAQDTGQVRVAIIEEVVVTATVNTSLTFTVSGVNPGQTVNTSPTTTAATTTATTLPFGVLPTTGSVTLAQDLSVATNAANGFSVTVQTSGPFDSSTGAIIDGFIDGADTFTPVAWQAPGADVADITTYGHWAMTSDDATTSRAALDEFDADEWAAPTTTPIVIMGHTAPSDGVVAGEGATRVGYQVGISVLQEAGDDYETTLRYIATPTF